MSDRGKQMNGDRTQDMSDREGKKRDLPGLRKVRATTSQSGVQGEGGRQEPQLALKSEKTANRFKRIILLYICLRTAEMLSIHPIFSMSGIKAYLLWEHRLLLFACVFIRAENYLPS